MYPYLPRKTLVNIYKAFVRPHLDYGDIIYDNPSNDTFWHKIESVQCNAALAITGAIRGTSREKLYQELGLEYLSDRRWCRNIVFFYKIINNQTTSLKFYFTKKNFFFFYQDQTTSIFIFPYCISKWNLLDPKLQNSVSLSF